MTGDVAKNRERDGGGTDRSVSQGRPERVLVVDLGFLGDTVHLIPALQELRRHHAHAELHVVTTPVGAEVLALVSGVTRVWVHPLSNPSPPWWRHLGLVWALRRQRFDLGVNFSGADRTLFVMAAAAPRRRFTRACRRYAFWQRWLAGKVIPAPSRSQPVYEQRRQVLASAGYALEPARFGLVPPAEEGRWAEGRVASGAIHVSISASTPFKEWPLDSWVAAVSQLLAGGVPQVVATGAASGRERERLEALARRVGDARLKVLEGPLSIARLTAVVARCVMHLGTDSGVTHLAWALGRPTVSVYREYAGLEEWRPRGPGHRALTAPCGCVDRPRMRSECEAAGTALCLASVSVEGVVEAAREVWRAQVGAGPGQ